MRVAAERLDFGEVWENDQFIWVLPIENHGPTEVRITDFSSSCTCSRIEPRTLVIPAGQSRDVALTLDLTAGTTTENDRSAARAFQINIVPNAGPKIGPIYWKLQGKVRAPFCFEKPQLDFGRRSELAQPLAPRTVTITGLTPLATLSAKTTSAHFQAHVRRTGSAPDRFELTVTQTATLPRGFHAFGVKVIPIAQDGEQLPTKNLPVRVWVESDIQTSPPDVVFGARPLGERVEETVSLHSLTSQPFQVIGVKVEGNGLKVDRLNEDAEGQAYQLKQDVAKMETQRGRVVFRIRSQQGKEEDLSLDVSYQGITVPRK